MQLSRPFQRAYMKAVLAHFGSNCILMGNIRLKRPRFIWIGNNITFGKETLLYTHPSNKGQKDPILIIGDSSFISEHCYISAQAGIVIEEKVIVSPGTVIQDHSHGYTDVTLAVMDQPVVDIRPIKVGKGSWIGRNAALIPGADIGKNCVIGINAVVNRAIPDFCVAVGAPARVVKHYDSEKQQWIRGEPRPL